MDINSFALGYSAGKKQGGGGELVKKDVNFYDYDGTLLYAYTVEEAQKLKSLPKLPTQPGLVCQEWNWTLDDIKEQNGKVNVGATYTTDDGKTRLYIKIAEEIRTTVSVWFTQSVKNGVTIDWGDGSDTETTSGEGRVSLSHTYADIGDYVISMDVVDGCNTVLGHSDGTSVLGKASGANYDCLCMLQKAEIGDRIYQISYSTFYYCYSLSTVSIPKDTIVFGSTFLECISLKSVVLPNGTLKVYEHMFKNCQSLQNVAMPKSVTAIESYAFNSCYSLTEIILHRGITSIGENAFIVCYSIESIEIPEGVTSIGGSAFSQCYSLKSVVVPGSVTSVGMYAFSKCISLTNFEMPKTVKAVSQYMFSESGLLKKVIMHEGVTKIEQYAFNKCTSLTSVEMPESITSIETYAFFYCYSLKSIVIPKKVKTIGASAFSNCRILTRVVMPPSVTSIGGSAFSSCVGMKIYDFTQHTSVPTLNGTNAFKNIPSDCEIRVPASLYDSWIAATNWSAYASNIVAV